MSSTIYVRNVPEDPYTKMKEHTLFVTGGTPGISQLLGDIVNNIEVEFPEIFEKALYLWDASGECDWHDLTPEEFRIVLKATILRFESFMTDFMKAKDKNVKLSMLKLWTEYIHYMTSDPRSGFAVRPLDYNLF